MHLSVQGGVLVELRTRLLYILHIHLDAAVVGEHAASRSHVDHVLLFWLAELDDPVAYTFGYHSGNGKLVQDVVDVARAHPCGIFLAGWWMSERRVETVQMPMEAAARNVARDDWATVQRRLAAVVAQDGVAFAVLESGVVWHDIPATATLPNMGISWVSDGVSMNFTYSNGLRFTTSLKSPFSAVSTFS